MACIAFTGPLIQSLTGPFVRLCSEAFSANIGPELERSVGWTHQLCHDHVRFRCPLFAWEAIDTAPHKIGRPDDDFTLISPAYANTFSNKSN